MAVGARSQEIPGSGPPPVTFSSHCFSGEVRVSGPGFPVNFPELVEVRATWAHPSPGLSCGGL